MHFSRALRSREFPSGLFSSSSSLLIFASFPVSMRLESIEQARGPLRGTDITSSARTYRFLTDGNLAVILYSLQAASILYYLLYLQAVSKTLRTRAENPDRVGSVLNATDTKLTGTSSVVLLYTRHAYCDPVRSTDSRIPRLSVDCSSSIDIANFRYCVGYRGAERERERERGKGGRGPS